MEGWRTCSLGEICQIELGGTPARKSLNLWDPDKATDNVWLSIADLPQTLNACVTKSKEHISDSAAVKAKLVLEGTLLVSFKLTLGRLAFAGRDLYTNEAIASLTILDEQKIMKKYLYWYLTYFDWDKAAEGEEKIKGKTLNKKKLKVLPIILSSLPEQEQIVAILDEAFEAIATATANAEKNLDNTRELFESELNRVFFKKGKGWTETTLGNLCAGMEYGSSAKSSPEGKVPVLRMGNIQEGVIDWDNLKFTSDKEEINKYLLESGDILFNRTNSAELVGKTAIYRGTQPAVFAGYLIRVHYHKNLLDPDFLNFFLNSYRTREYGRMVMSRSVNQANINATKLRSYSITIPSLEQQRRIAVGFKDMSGEIKHLENITKNKLTLLTELKQSILQKAFSGELTADNKIVERKLSEAGV